MKFIPIESVDLIPDNALIKCKFKDKEAIIYHVFRRISPSTAILGGHFIWDVKDSYDLISYVEIIEE